VDDRPPKNKDPEWVAKLNAAAVAIIEMYPDCKEAFTEMQRVKD